MTAYIAKQEGGTRRSVNGPWLSASGVGKGGLGVKTPPMALRRTFFLRYIDENWIQCVKNE